MQYLIVALALFAAAQAAPQIVLQSVIPQALPQVIPTVQADGHLADTPAVAAAKAEHFQAHAKALGLAPPAPAPLINSPAVLTGPISPAVLSAPSVVAASASPYIQPVVKSINPAYLNTPTIRISSPLIQPVVKAYSPYLY